jgi:DNA-binding GntR family transcriptional regulator
MRPGGNGEGHGMAQRKSALSLAKPERDDASAPRSAGNLFEAAYLKIEELLVNCSLKPGRFLTVQELQNLTGFGRTPVHAAVNSLAADTLILIRPRHGLQIAPIDLGRERLLLALRRDMERFVVKLAAERASLSHRNQMQHIERALSERRNALSIDEFNQFDRRIDALILAASSEPFLVHTMRPLHTIYRRIGYIYHRLLPDHDLTGTIDRHIVILAAVAGQRASAAVKASDTLMDFMDQMFADMATGIDPGLLDCNIEPLPPI